jgi:hypothetical protein
MNDTRGLYDDLRDVQVKKVENYWLKTTGVSSMQAAGVTEEMRLGAGRWRRSAGSAAGRGRRGRWLCTTCRPRPSRSWMCPTSVLVGLSVIISVVLGAWCLGLPTLP